MCKKCGKSRRAGTGDRRFRADTRSSTTFNTYHSLDATILERLANPITAGMKESINELPAVDRKLFRCV